MEGVTGQGGCREIHSGQRNNKKQVGSSPPPGHSPRQSPELGGTKTALFSALCRELLFPRARDLEPSCLFVAVFVCFVCFKSFIL